MLRVRVVVSAVWALKFWTLAVAVFMLFAKLYMAAAAATITATPTPVRARNVAKLCFRLSARL
jgi:hypothetical protein